MQLTKPGLREQLKAKRLALSAAERQAKSRIIVDKLGEVVDWSQVKTVHTFEPLTKFAEVDISGFRPDAEIFYSKKINGEWQNVAHKQNTAIPEKFDIIIVPMLGFDKTLHRIGYGGGFYDKFLATQPEAKKSVFVLKSAGSMSCRSSHTT